MRNILQVDTELLFTRIVLVLKLGTARLLFQLFNVQPRLGRCRRLFLLQAGSEHTTACIRDRESILHH
jgi:hypothetical protein